MKNLDKLLKNRDQNSPVTVFFQHESPYYHWEYIDYRKKNGFYNYTMTYRLDSEIPWPYFTLFELMCMEKERAIRSAQRKKQSISSINELEAHSPKSFFSLPLTYNATSKKSKKILAVISNCNNKERIRMISILQKNIKTPDGKRAIDFYGACSQNPKKVEKLENLRAQYKFYLAFENSKCLDYITEKFWYTILAKSVPIVYGTTRERYELLAPKSSFIHVDDFGSLKKLAKHLTLLLNDDSEYSKYFHWRYEYNLDKEIEKLKFADQNGQDEQGLCRLCQLTIEPERNVVSSLEKFWYGDKKNKTCDRKL